MASQKAIRYRNFTIVFLIFFIIVLSIPLAIEFMFLLPFTRLFAPLAFYDTGLTITTWIESVIVFVGAFFGVVLAKRLCKKARCEE